MKTRRDFIKTSSAATLGMLIPIRMNRPDSSKFIGIQLYSIREKLNIDFEASMRKIAEIGFNTVETAGYSDNKFYAYTPKEFKKFTDSINIKALSSHANFQWKNLDQTIEDTLEAGMEYLVKPSINQALRNTLDDYKRLSDEFNQIGEKCKNSGLHFAYHNHAFEFNKIDGYLPYNVLLENTEADLVSMQMDTYWIVYGGYDPIDYINKYPGRFELLHIKDMDNSEKRESTEIGKGIIDFEEILALNKLSGMKYSFMEQESFKMDMFESLSISYNYLNSVL